MQVAGTKEKSYVQYSTTDLEKSRIMLVDWSWRKGDWILCDSRMPHFWNDFYCMGELGLLE